MGQAKITGGGPDALYNIEIIKHPGKSAARLTAIATRLTELAPLIVLATDAVDAAIAALAAAQTALDAILVAYTAGTATKEQTTAATTAVIAAQTALTQKRRDLSRLSLEQSALITEQSRLTTAMAAETRTGVWCTDLTEGLAVGAIVGTMEMNGVDDEIILTPGGDVAESLGELQHAGVSTPAGVFYNKALLPAWQKWKPTYRVGTITAIDYETDTCDVGIVAQFSSEQGLAVNQSGTAWTAASVALQGWNNFAAENPSFALVTNTASTTISTTAQLTADMAAVQADVGNRNKYKTDAEQYQTLDHWAIMEEGGSGDCEDFALTKAKKLLDMGYPASALHIEIGALKGVPHAWLVVQTDNGDMALDNRFQGIMKNDALPYTDRRRQTGMNWGQSGVLLEDVPIEYMDGSDSELFLVGDSVVVQFVGQSWSAPKVVGFETNPRGGDDILVACDSLYEISGGHEFKAYTCYLTKSSYTSSDVVTVPMMASSYNPSYGAVYYSCKNHAYIFPVSYYVGATLVNQLHSISADTGAAIAQITTPVRFLWGEGYARLPAGDERFAYYGADGMVYIYDENLQFISSHIRVVGLSITIMCQDGELVSGAIKPGPAYTYYGITKSKKMIYSYIETSTSTISSPNGEWEFVYGGTCPGQGWYWHWRSWSVLHTLTKIGKYELRLYDLDGINYTKVCDLETGKKKETFQNIQPGGGLTDVCDKPDPWADVSLIEASSDVTSYAMSIASIGEYLAIQSTGNFSIYLVLWAWVEEITVPSSLKIYHETDGFRYEIPRTKSFVVGGGMPLGNVSWGRKKLAA